MIVFYKNYKRSDRTFLSIQSVKHLFPELEIKCLFLYKETTDEYADVIPKFEALGVECFLDKKKYDFGNLNGAGTPYNGYYFTEGINKIYGIMQDHDGKVLIVDEDSYFTSGETINFLLNTDFDLAWAHWAAPNPVRYAERPKNAHVNGSIVGINPVKVSTAFPIPEVEEFIEVLLGYELHDKCLAHGCTIVRIPTRDFVNYCGDGTHTNDINEMRKHLTQSKIPFVEL